MKIAVIGAGNMGSAIIHSIVDNKMVDSSDLIICRKNSGKTIDGLPDLRIYSDIKYVIEQADTVIMAVKPQQAQDIFNSSSNCFSNKFVLSIMAGWPFEKLKAVLPQNTRILCAMPNLLLSVKEGITLFSEHCNCTEDEYAFAKALFERAGTVVSVDDSYFAAANAVSGCAPAFVCLFIEALSDGAVRYGVPRKLAYEIITQMLIGTAQFLHQKGLHPGELKDAVCSPKGITIAGIQSLENDGFRAAVINAVEACVLKEKEMS